MSRSSLRGVAIAGVAALTFAAPASAFAASHGHTHQAKAKTHSSHKHHGKPASKKFTATGTVVSVDAAAGTVTINDKGGSKDLHKQTITVAVSPTTKVTRNDAPASLGDLQAGDHVAANGTRADGGVLNAKHVNAESAPAPEPSESSDSSTTDSSTSDSTTTDAPAPQPTQTATTPA